MWAETEPFMTGTWIGCCSVMVMTAGRGGLGPEVCRGLTFDLS